MAKGKTAKHTGCRRGTKVLLKLRDGSEVADIFHERTDKFIFLKERGKIHKNKVRSFQALGTRLLNSRTLLKQGVENGDK